MSSARKGPRGKIESYMSVHMFVSINNSFVSIFWLVFFSSV